MASFLEKNRDFVLKLKIKTSHDQVQIRRVNLPRIADADGKVSYEELTGLVLVFTLPEDDPTNSNVRSYAVSLTYYDNEKDLITIASTEELMDAIELFGEQKFMRITTSVKPKISVPAASASACVQDNHPLSSMEVGSSKKGDKDPQLLPIRNVLETFAGTLSNAVVNLQEGLATQSPASNRLDLNSSAPPPSNVKNEKSFKSHIIGKNKKGPKRKVNNQATRKNIATAARSPSHIKSDSKDQLSSKSSDKTGNPEESDTVEPFIHGRHTCDGCLITPIVGKRYHATNLPDYDLCQKCFDNYKGNEIKFESMELHRDIAFQSRWRRRHQMAVKLMARRSLSGRGSCGPRSPRDREQNNGNVNGVAGQRNRTPMKMDPKQISSAHPASLKSNIGRFKKNGVDPNPVNFENTLSSNQFDNSLKEAIRRSLEDVAKKENSTTKATESTETDKKDPIGLTKSEVPSETAKPRAVEEKSAEINEVKEELKAQRIVSKEKALANNEVSENAASGIEDGIPRSVDIVQHKMIDVEQHLNGNAKMENSVAPFEPEEIKTMEESMEVDSVDSEKLVSESSGRNSLPLSPLTGTGSDDHPVNSSFSKRDLEISKFASDAVGNGDVAEVMGKTLDMVAGVINEMLSESENPEKQNENGRDSESKEGELIVNSNDDMDSDDAIPKVDDKEDDTDWSVVKSIGSSGTTESEQMGKATEMLGSALFNSDMKNSVEDKGSNLVSSVSSFSVPSSVPTDLGTVNSRVAGATQASRWATQLEKLRELGFEDEEACVEILERIALDSNETMATIIDRVVDELLSMNVQ